MREFYALSLSPSIRVATMYYPSLHHRGIDEPAIYCILKFISLCSLDNCRDCNSESLFIVTSWLEVFSCHTTLWYSLRYKPYGLTFLELGQQLYSYISTYNYKSEDNKTEIAT